MISTKIIFVSLISILILSFTILVYRSFYYERSDFSSSCGRNESLISIKIIGGNISHEGEWPWQVFLNKTINYGAFAVNTYCGASIIDEDWILTAAHCVLDFDPNFKHLGRGKTKIEAIFGSVDLLDPENTFVRRTIQKVIMHEDFDYDTRFNDIAMLKLDSSLNSNDVYLNAICLPTTFSDEFFDDCFSTGFGFQDKELKNNDYKLRKLPEKLFDIKECKKHFEDVNSLSSFCMGGISGQGNCVGDSGSPLQCYNSVEKRWYQMGLISYGNEQCASPNIPDVFTRVSFFYDWILKQKELN